MFISPPGHPLKIHFDRDSLKSFNEKRSDPSTIVLNNQMTLTTVYGFIGNVSLAHWEHNHPKWLLIFIITKLHFNTFKAES